MDLLTGNPTADIYYRQQARRETQGRIGVIDAIPPNRQPPHLN